MELKAYFSNLHKVIIEHLEQSQSEIVAAIAWFTDRDIFEVLCKKARSGVKVSVVLIGDDINQGLGGLNFQKLINLGGQVEFLPSGCRTEPIMHHKFCVIDHSIVITGSYNWSQKARSNDENITVVTDSVDFARKYLDTFHSLLERVGHNTPVLDIDAVQRRLEMIRNLILLGEQDGVPMHLLKLRPVAEALQLNLLILTLEKGEYKAAIKHIDIYLTKATALVEVIHTNIAGLRFYLETLELRLESLSDEKIELERRLITFNRRHDDALGDLIKSILKERAKLARLLAEERMKGKERDEAESAAQEAEEAYSDYAEQHEELQRTQPIPKLDEEDERELKSIYRKACSLCHPDKVPDEKKQAALGLFVELQVAYKVNNLTRVQEVYEVLKTGGVLETRSTTLSKVDALKAAIAELEYAITKLLSELKILQGCNGVKLMEAAGTAELDWQSFFEHQQELLKIELARIVTNILAMQTDE